MIANTYVVLVIFGPHCAGVFDGEVAFGPIETHGTSVDTNSAKSGREDGLLGETSGPVTSGLGQRAGE